MPTHDVAQRSSLQKLGQIANRAFDVLVVAACFGGGSFVLCMIAAMLLILKIYPAALKTPPHSNVIFWGVTGLLFSSIWATVWYFAAPIERWIINVVDELERDESC